MDENRCNSVPVQPVRRIRPTRRSVSGVYMFRKEAAIPFESTLERDFLIRAEFDLEVLDVAAQPVSIPFVDNNGRRSTYVPDFLVHYRLGTRSADNYPKPMLVEVKPYEAWHLNWRTWFGKWKAARQYARSQGWQFRIYDESRIRDQAFQNIRFLERFKRMDFPQAESEWIVGNLRQMGATSFHYLLSRHFMGMYRANGIAHLWYLLASRQIACDMSRPLGEQTELWVPDHE